MNTKRDRQRANRAASVAAAEAAFARNRTRNRILTYGGIAAALILALVVVNVLTGDDSATVTPSTATTVGPNGDPADTSDNAGECPAVDGSSARRIDFTAPQPTCIDPTASYTAIFDTTEGEIRVDLDAAATPGTVNNFVTLARWGYYDGTTIFRTDPSIDIIQGGSPHTESASDPGPGYQILDEPTFQADDSGALVGPYRYVPGQLVMARARGANSASAQFFFTTGANAAGLNGQGIYVVFGETDNTGLGVLQGIIGLHEPTGDLGGAPSRTVTINTVTIEES